MHFSSKSTKTPPRVRLKSVKCILSVFGLIFCVQVVSANKPPRFLIDGRSEIVIRLKEGSDTPVGSLIYRLRGIDPDGDSLKFGIREQIGSDILRIEAISSNEANIYLVKLLDREIRDEYSFVLTLTDGLLGEGNYITQSLLLLVEDVNDNEPIFRPYPAAITVKEDASPGVLLTVEATDLDEGAYGQVLYNLQELDGDNENFAIQTVNGKGVIRLINRLDYERKSLYQLRVLAVDRANQGRVNTGTAAILVKVQDVEDQPPEFVVASPVTRIIEDAPVGTSVLQVRAIDGDRGINNRISYSIISGGEDYFDIDSSSGVVFTVYPLDREDPNNSNGAYILEILATEESHTVSPLPSATTEVTVIIMDINDERPTFRSTKYVGEIIENAQQNTPITFLQDGLPEVFDYDQGKNGTFELYLEGDNGVFDVTPFRGVNEASFSIRVNDPSLLDYERVTVMNFTLVAREIVGTDPKTSTVPVTVHIRDENDNFPEFSSPVYLASVAEDCSAGSGVARVTATDRDRDGTGAAGVRYTGLAGGVAHLLQLNPVSGVITFKQACGESFDRELVSQHYVTVEARDDQGKGNRNTVQLIINIEDVNDNAPMFLANKYEARLLENAKEFENPLVLEARDIDLNGTDNSRIEYSIVEGVYRNNFTIDPKLGIIMPIGGLDFEKIPGTDSNIRAIHLTVEARDFGSPSLSSSVSVTIYLSDVNDHAPVFTQPEYRRAIPEDMASGSSVLEVKALDGDGSSPNNRVVYRIERGATDAFTLDARSGLLRVAPAARLDPDITHPRTTEQLLTVVASDGGIGDQQLSASIIINITILDVNNKPPVFIEPGIVHVSENTAVGTAVVRVRARDPDERPALRYSVRPGASAAKGGGGGALDRAGLDYVALWTLDAVDGTLRVARSPDREKVEIIKLAIEVEDLAAAEGGPRQIASAILTIVVDDENDNNPVFRKLIYRSSVPENSKNGHPIVVVRADDADENGTVTYALEAPEELLKLVQIDRLTGEVVVSSRIDHETQPWINVTATATDSGVPARRTAVDVHIQILDENDNNPIFEISPFEYRVREDVEPGTIVANIVAKDLDSGEYGRITYLLDRVSTQGKFLINPDTGALRVSDELDREARASYTLVVEAWDNYQFGYQSGESRNAFKQIVIHIEDVNDNSPILFLPTGLTTISEFHDHREAILSVSATDADDVTTPNGRVQFYLVGGKGHDLFRLERDSSDANAARLFARQPLRERFGNYSLLVEARDGGTPPRAAAAALALAVADYNDHAPVFIRPRAASALRVPENATIGTTVLEVKAIDADIGPNGAVRYRLGRDVRADYRAFTLHDTSGALRTATTLDRDKQTTYQLRLEAYDLGLPTPLSSSLDLTIYVQNVDDYRPRFPQKHFYLNITENEEHSAVLPGVIERDETDRGDEPVLPVCMYIVDGNDDGAFELDRTSYRLSSKHLDREQKDKYVLSVLATEDCITRPTYNESVDAISTLKVVVGVLDVNDNAPQFVSKIFTGGITTEADFGIEFMHIKAIDKDEGPNAEIGYYLEGEVKETLTEGLEGLAAAPFLVDPLTGAVALNFDPQRGMKGYFDFKVCANDSGGLRDEAHVFIYLLRADQRVRVVLRSQRAGLRERLPAFTARLQAVTGARVHVDDLRAHENRDGSVDATRSDLYLHLVDADHSVLDVARVLELVDENTERLDDLFKTRRSFLAFHGFTVRVPGRPIALHGEECQQCLGLATQEFNVLDTQPASYDPPAAASLSSSQAVYWLAWGALLLAVLLLLAVAAALAQRADYGRKLKAATTAAYSSPTPGESDMTIRSSGGRVPNTNKHTTKGSNPIWLHAYENDWYKSEDQLSHSERDSLDENAVDRDLSNDKPYFITTASFPSIRSDETEPETEANRGNYDFYQQLEQMKNAKNMETTEL